MKKCEICGKLYDESYDKCPHSHLFINKNHNIVEPPNSEDAKKGCLSCLGCLGLIIIALFIFGFIGSKDNEIKNPETVHYKEKSEKQQEKATITFETISFNESDLPYLEKYVRQYFSDIELEEYNFRYYIDPLVWNSNPYSGKEAIMVRSAAYGIIKTKQYKTSASGALGRVHILNMNTGEELGSYGLTGYQFK